MIPSEPDSTENDWMHIHPDGIHDCVPPDIPLFNEDNPAEHRCQSLSLRELPGYLLFHEEDSEEQQLIAVSASSDDESDKAEPDVSNQPEFSKFEDSKQHNQEMAHEIMIQQCFKDMTTTIMLKRRRRRLSTLGMITLTILILAIAIVYIPIHEVHEVEVDLPMQQRTPFEIVRYTNASIQKQSQASALEMVCARYLRFVLRMLKWSAEAHKLWKHFLTAKFVPRLGI